MKCLIAIVGPTAVGKSRLALYLAQHFGGEIINADSRQVYRYMDIGTAKPTPEERSIVPHHLIDVVDPDEPFSLAIYRQMAEQSINQIQLQQKVPFLVGGSGLYVWTMAEGWQIPPVPPNPAFRQRLEQQARDKGIEELFLELRRIDPIAAAKIMPTNLRRIIRALEVYSMSGRPMSQYWQKIPPVFPILIIGLTLERAELYRRIDLRVDEMLKRGLVEEVRQLVNRGFGLHLPAMSGIGYRQIGAYLQGKISLEEAVQQIKWQTHCFTRRQNSWFRTNDPRIHWFDAQNSDMQREIIRSIEAFLGDKAK